MAGRRILIGQLARQCRCRAVQLIRLVAQTIFFEFEFAATERVGFDDIDAELKIGRVDPLDDRRCDQHEVFVTSLLATIVFGGELHIENSGAHRAVVYDHTLASQLEKIIHSTNCRAASTTYWRNASLA